MNRINCGFQHAEAMRDIWNDVIENTTCHYDSQPRSLDEVKEWLQAKAEASLPVIGLEDANGKLAGFASYGPFRPQEAYRRTAEHSVYVEKSFRGLGLGRRLLDEIIAHAESQEYHVLVGVIDSANLASIELHKQRGFTHAGRIREAGFKFGEWLDADFYELVLPDRRR